MATVKQQDFYEVLGVSSEATQQEIRKAYLKLAHKYHPDKTGGDKDAEEELKRVNEAYDVLKNADKRREYDEQRSAASAFAYGRGFGDGGSHASGGGFDFAGSGFGSSFEDLFGAFVGRGQQAARRAVRPGNDLETSVQVTLREVACGTKKAVRVPRADPCPDCGGAGAAPGHKPEACPDCGGTGMAHFSRGTFSVSQTCRRCGGAGTWVSDPCRRCGGNGRIRTERELTVTIPAGVAAGTRLRLAGEGEPGENGGPSGDLYVLVTIAQDPLFEREGDNLVCETPVTVAQAILGGKVRVPTLDGAAEVNVPPGTQDGALLRMRGLGLPSLRGGGKGDQLVRVKVEVPKHISREQRELIEKFDGLTAPGAYPRRKRFVERLKRNRAG